MNSNINKLFFTFLIVIVGPAVILAIQLDKEIISVIDCKPCILNKDSIDHKSHIFLVIEDREIKKLKITTGKFTQVFSLLNKYDDYPVPVFGEYDLHTIDLNKDGFLDFGVSVPSESRNPKFIYFLYNPANKNFTKLGQFGHLVAKSTTSLFVAKTYTSRYYDFEYRTYKMKNSKLVLVNRIDSIFKSNDQIATVNETRFINGREELVGRRLLPLMGSMASKKYFQELSKAYKTSLVHFKRKDIDRSISVLEKYFNDYEYTRIFFNDNLYNLYLNIMNDYAFFLEQAKKYRESIEILNFVIKTTPKRIVAFINLGDAYYGIGDTDNAKNSYQTYIDLMKKNGKQKRIPKRVYDRVK